MKTKEKIANISVLGAGLWGTVLAGHLARKGHAVKLWEFFENLARNLEETRTHPHLPQFELPRSVRVVSDLKSAVDRAEIVLIVLPSAHVRATAAKLAAAMEPKQAKPWIVNASKGIEPKSLKTMGEVIEDEIPSLTGRVFTLSGPSFAREVARNVPTSLVLAGPDSRTAGKLRRIFSGKYVNVETSRDRKGVELGGSLKNVLAIGCGILDGMKGGAAGKAAQPAAGRGRASLPAALGGYGAATSSSLPASTARLPSRMYSQPGARGADRIRRARSTASLAAPGGYARQVIAAGANTKAALITQGIAEMARLIQTLGGRAETVYGLSGIGDLMATGTSPESRNRALGEKVGGGKNVAAALKEIPTVTEGVESAQSAHDLIVSCKISCPLLDAIWRVVRKGAPPEKVLDALGFSSYADVMPRARSTASFAAPGG